MEIHYASFGLKPTFIATLGSKALVQARFNIRGGVPRACCFSLFVNHYLIGRSELPFSLRTEIKPAVFS